MKPDSRHLLAPSIRAALLVVVAALWLVPSALAKPGELDPTFGRHGVGSAGSGFPGTGWAGPQLQTVRSSEGTVFVLSAGNSFLVPGRITAFTANGQVDKEFGTNGRLVFTELAGLPFNVDGIAVDAKGRLVVSGERALAGEHELGVVRLLPDGSVDPSFGGVGFVLAQPKIQIGGNYLQGGIWNPRVAVDPAGRVLVSAAMNPDCPIGVDVLRFAENGEVDRSFGREGVVYLEGATQAYTTSAPYPVGGEGGFELAVASGDASCPEHSLRANVPALLRFGPTGALDPAFGVSGRAELAQRSTTALGFDSLGRTLVLSGSTGSVSRYSTSGVLDPTYGNGGVAELPGEWTKSGFAVTGNGSVLVTGTVGRVNPEHSELINRAVVLARLDANGKLVRGYGKQGLVKTRFGSGGEAVGQSILLDGVGHALVAGPVTSPKNPKVAAGVGLFQFDLTN